MGTLVFSVDVMAPNNYMKFWLLRGLDLLHTVWKKQPMKTLLSNRFIKEREPRILEQTVEMWLRQRLALAVYFT